ncbi:MAG: cation diffusion facilitator family transporter [Candidatus Nitrosopolaris sp.]
MVASSKKAVYTALVGNLGIAVAKLIAAILTGSIAMLAETLHSMSDTFNQVLLLIGIKTSVKAATERHPFGYGKEQFFWSFIVATMLFGISGFISLQQGFSSLISTFHHIENVNISYIILAISAVFEANALRVVLELSKQSIEARGEKFSLRALLYEFQESKDPSIMTIMVEDSAALLGIAIAATGIFLSNQTGNTIYDSISSLLIGTILMAFAFFLARENKGLLIGEAISRQEYKRIVRLIKEIPEVNKIITIRTMHLAPKDVLVAIEVNLIDGLDTDKIETVIDNIERKVKQAIPYVNLAKVFVELERDRVSDLYKRKGWR